MAKKPQTPVTPEITVLPMTGGDSPMVIDLPDGQKLIVSNLSAGSVIEVATWRGTGRPDSRTTRLMLGMTSGQTKPAEGSPSDGKAPSQSKTAIVLGKAGAVLNNLITKVKESKTNLAQKKKAPLIEKVVPPTRSSEDVSVDDWLNSILEKSAKKKAPVKPAEENMAEPKPTAKRAPAKKAPAKRAVKKTTTGRAR